MTQDNTGKIIAVGDIHGCDEALEVLLSVLLRWPGTCVFLGDYLDRGPSSVRVIELLHNARKQRPDWKFLMGNHEAMFLDILESGLDILTPDSAAEEYAQIGAVPGITVSFWKTFCPGGSRKHSCLFMVVSARTRICQLKSMIWKNCFGHVGFRPSGGAKPLSAGMMLWITPASSKTTSTWIPAVVMDMR